MGVSEEFARDEGKLEVDLGVEHHFLGGIYAKRIQIPAGAYVISHSHPYTHMSVLAKGRVIVETDRSRRIHEGPAYLTIEAHLHHKIIALDDALWFCIHATDCEDADQVDDVILKKAG